METPASQHPPAAATSSTCNPQTARGRHVFQIEGYSLHRGFGAGKFVQSAAFAVGGYSWCIRCYPDGAGNDSRGYISVFLRLMSRNAKVTALYEIRLLGKTTGLSPAAPSTAGRILFDTMNSDEAAWGRNLFMKASELEASAEYYLHDDRLVIECDVTVIMEPLVTEAITKAVEVRVPPSSDLPDDYGKLLETGEGVDMIFMVQDEYFFAHRIVLVARSPVFSAELCGTRDGEHSRGCITIEDMQPATFKALLHFIYTDSLPPINDLDVDEVHAMVKNLFVAADRYAMERLKMICKGILCKSLNDGIAASKLDLADQYNCSELKDIYMKYTNSSDRVCDVVASQQGNQGLKRAKRTIWVVLWEKTRCLFRFKK